MKIFNDKGYPIMRYLMISTAAMFWLSCEDDREVIYDEGIATEQIIVDSYLRIVTPVVGFQAGTEKYGYTYDVVNGEKSVTEIKVYSTFTDAETGLESNEVLLASQDVESGNVTQQTDTLTYDDLKEGLLVNGQPLPADELLLKVGSGWALRFEGLTESGEVIRLPGAINIAVLSRFAGIYKFTYIEYWRIGVLRNDVSDPIIGTELFIGSVDENTFSHNDWWGPFAWTGCAFNFDVDFDDNSITVPILTSCGLFSGTEALGCPNLSIVNCVSSNILIPDDVTGKHVIKMSYGYVGAGGNREFYCEYEKVVD